MNEPTRAEAPTAELLWARRGTAYFARKLNELPDEEFGAPSLLQNWSRAHLIAHVGYNARALCRLLEWANTGVETPMYSSTGQRNEEIQLGATLPPIALRNLCDHAAVHLNVEWRDLPSEAWGTEIRTAQGRLVPVAETAWMRAREVWVHAVDLDNGGSFVDFPPAFVDRLLADVLAGWARKGTPAGVILNPTDRDARLASEPDAATVVSGTAADLARWVTGRGARRLTTEDSAPLPALPTWL